MCLGLNYISHAKESAQARGREFKIPEAPVFFTKAPTSVTGPTDPIPWDPSVTAQLDYEAELGVVIGIPGKDIPRARALDHVFGYTIINDVSARDLQKTHLQWFKGKSLDGFCPVGPVIVTADEFGDPQSKQISLRVNGVEKQSSTTANMIFPVDVDHRVAVAGPDHRGGRPDRDRHAGRRRPRRARRRSSCRTATSSKPRSRASASCGTGLSELRTIPPWMMLL